MGLICTVADDDEVGDVMAVDIVVMPVEDAADGLWGDA